MLFIGHGQSNWSQILEILQETNYEGAICIELEDANYNDTEEDQKQGVLQGLRFLESVF